MRPDHHCRQRCHHAIHYLWRLLFFFHIGKYRLLFNNLLLPESRDLKKPLEDVSWTLEMLNRGTSQADTAAHHRHDPRTLRSWLKRAAAQAMRVHDAYFQNLKLGNLGSPELNGKAT